MPLPYPRRPQRLYSRYVNRLLIRRWTMLRYSEQDATRIQELQEITAQFRRSLMRAIACKRIIGANWHVPDILQKLGSEACKAQSEIDDIVLRNYRRQGNALSLLSPMSTKTSRDGPQVE